MAAAAVVLAGGAGAGITYGATHPTQPAGKPPTAGGAMAAAMPAVRSAPAPDDSFDMPIPTPMIATLQIHPQRTTSGVTLLITIANPTSAAVDVDTGMMPKPTLDYDGAPVYLYTIPERQHLTPGASFQYVCTAKLPPTAGRLVVHVGPMITIAGPLPAAPA